MTKEAQFDKDTLVGMVIDHAYANYETGGWDILVECHDRSEIKKALGRSTTFSGAKWAVRENLGIYLQAEMRQSVMNEVF